MFPIVGFYVGCAALNVTLSLISYFKRDKEKEKKELEELKKKQEQEKRKREKLLKEAKENLEKIKNVGNKIVETTRYVFKCVSNFFIDCFNVCKYFFIKYEAEIKLAAGIGSSVLPLCSIVKNFKTVKDVFGITLLPIKTYTPPLNPTEYI